MTTNTADAETWEGIRNKYIHLLELNNDNAKKERDDIFSSFDPNGNGYLSLAELEKGCRDELKIDFINDKRVIRKAYMKSKSIASEKNPDVVSQYGPDYVERSEFRYFIVYLLQYYDIWFTLYTKLATSSNDSDNDNDYRISKDKFESNYSVIQEWDKENVFDSNATPDEVFDVIDTNHGGYILFDELADYIIMKTI